jgi:hypothetical protein
MKNDNIGNKFLISSLILFFLFSAIKGERIAKDQTRCLFRISDSEFLNFNSLKSGVGENKYINIFLIINNII